MISKLAEEIYSNSIQLKRYNSRNLFFKKNRLTLEKELYEIQEKTESILHELYSNTDYSIEQYKLALFMNKTLSECIVFLTSKSKSNRETVKRYIWGFHNLPRAFLSTDNPMKISSDEAMNYFRSYLKMD